MQKAGSGSVETSQALVVGGEERKKAELEQVKSVAQGDATKQPLDDEEYVLEAFGDISLSNIDFVPPPPSTLTPQKVAISKSITSRRNPSVDTAFKVRLSSAGHQSVPLTPLSARSLVARTTHTNGLYRSPRRAGAMSATCHLRAWSRR